MIVFVQKSYQPNSVPRLVKEHIHGLATPANMHNLSQSIRIGIDPSHAKTTSKYYRSRYRCLVLLNPLSKQILCLLLLLSSILQKGGVQLNLSHGLSILPSNLGIRPKILVLTEIRFVGGSPIGAHKTPDSENLCLLRSNVFSSELSSCR